MILDVLRIKLGALEAKVIDTGRCHQFCDGRKPTGSSLVTNPALRCRRTPVHTMTALQRGWVLLTQLVSARSPLADCGPSVSPADEEVVA